MRYTQSIFFILYSISVLFTKAKEYDKNELSTEFSKLPEENYSCFDEVLKIDNDNFQYQNTLSLPKPFKLSENAYKLEIVFDNVNQIAIISTYSSKNDSDDKPRKLQRIPLIYPNISNSIDAALENAAQKGIAAMKTFYEEVEPDIIKKGQFLEEDHPGAVLSKFSAPYEIVDNDEQAAYATLSATKYFQKSYKLRATEFGRQSSDGQITFRQTSLEGFCPPREPPVCIPAALRYRTHDGTCNNLRRSRWGSAQMPFNRFLPPDYQDGVDSVRESVAGGPLASSRFVSLVVHGAKDGDAPVTLMLAQWGQLIDHDLTSTAQPRSINGSIPRCCGADDKHPSCFPIKVPFDDPWLAPLKVRCLEFLRSAAAHRRDCSLAWREQTNQATSFLDASPIYSSNARMSDIARVFRNGLLIFGSGNPRDDICLRGAISSKCIRAGDPRSGEQPGLLALHHVWVREHNRIAQELSNLNPHWSDEKVYQETRRIIGALFQHITYREFLPVVLGREVCKLFDLELMNSGYYTAYDVNINPTVANSFAAAAFRFGHSLVQGSYLRCDKNHNFIRNNVTLHEEFTRGDLGNIESLHRLLRGMAAQKAQTRDEFITPELTNHLFQSGGFPFGLDLAAINIQRGRDHGIPKYTAWREPCGLSRIEHWKDLEAIIGPRSTIRMSHAYQSAHDIDLFVGGIAERPVIGGLVGPTFACIIAQQFSNLRKGDRFWYENSGFENSFTPAQLNAIRHVNLAQVLCRAVGGGTFQPHIFIPHDVLGNERLPCGVGPLSPIDLLPWIEIDPFINKHSSDLDTQETVSALFHQEPFTKLKNVTFINHIDFIPNGSTGIQIISNPVKNVTKINDKLDFKQKPSSHKKPEISIQNELTSQIQSLSLVEHKNDKLGIPPATLPGVLMFNNIPITISPISFDDEQAQMHTFQLRKSNRKPDRQLDRNTTLLKEENTAFNSKKIKVTKLNNNSNRSDDIINELTTHSSYQRCTNCKTGQNQNNNNALEKKYGNREITNDMKFKTILENDNDKLGVSKENSSENSHLITNEEIKNRIKRNTIDQNNTDNTVWRNLVQLNQKLISSKKTIQDEPQTTDVMNVRDILTTNKTVTSDENLTLNVNLTDTYTTAFQSCINLVNEKKQTDLTSTTISEFDPELRTYRDYFSDFETDLPTATTHMTYTKTNSAIIHDIDGRIEFFDETELTNTKQIHDEPNKNFVNTESTAVIDNNLRAMIPEGISEEEEEISFSNIPFVIKRNTQRKSNIVLVDILNQIITNNMGTHGAVSITSHPNANFNMTYINSTEKLELRQHNRPDASPTTIYGSKKQSQKIVIGSPDSEEYEIEINIRPVTNKIPNLGNQFENLPNIDSVYGHDYSQSVFNQKKQTKPLSSFSENSDYGQKTKPPTIIYVGEQEDRYQYTTRPSQLGQQSNIFQNLVTLDTSSDVYGHYYSVPPKNIAAASSSLSANGNGVASASSSSSTNFYSGSASATASTSSSGAFGSVSGSTSSSNTGSGPVFNVKIRPASFPNSFLYSHPTSPKPSYEFINSNKPLYSVNDYTSSPYSHRYSNLNANSNYNKPSAFSNNRLDEQYDNFQLLTTRSIASKLTAYQRLYNNNDFSEPRSHKLKNNQASSTIFHSETMTRNDANSTDATLQFDKDGYLRPEFTILHQDNLMNIMNSTTTRLNKTKINDDYVMPILQGNMTDFEIQNLENTPVSFLEPFSDVIAKHSETEILAEIEETIAMTSKINKLDGRKNNNDQIVFAPLKVLTRPERPDNWVVFNSSKSETSLPEPPELKLEALTSKEFPKPMNQISVGVLKPVVMKPNIKNATNPI